MHYFVPVLTQKKISLFHLIQLSQKILKIMNFDVIDNELLGNEIIKKIIASK